MNGKVGKVILAIILIFGLVGLTECLLKENCNCTTVSAGDGLMVTNVVNPNPCHCTFKPNNDNNLHWVTEDFKPGDSDSCITLRDGTKNETFCGPKTPGDGASSSRLEIDYNPSKNNPEFRLKVEEKPTQGGLPVFAYVLIALSVIILIVTVFYCLNKSGKRPNN